MKAGKNISLAWLILLLFVIYGVTAEFAFRPNARRVLVAFCLSKVSWPEL